MNYNNLPNLDESVLKALDFFAKNKPPRLALKQFSFPLVVGSGNAYNAAQIIFSGRPAVLANESNFKKILSAYKKLIKNKTIDGAIIISASGEKDSVWEIKSAKKFGLKTTLLTCAPGSSAARLADQVIIYKKLPEPYTYNVSTYLGIILSASGENAGNIKKFLSTIKIKNNLKKYESYAFILPDELAAVAPMLEIKRNELFGPHISLRAFSYGEARHAKFVNNSNKELIISFGENKYFGFKNNRLEIKLPKNAKHAFAMALGYYLVGQIQTNKPAYFKKNIATFCQEGPRAYGNTQPFSIIV